MLFIVTIRKKTVVAADKADLYRDRFSKDLFGKLEQPLDFSNGIPDPIEALGLPAKPPFNPDKVAKDLIGSELGERRGVLNPDHLLQRIENLSNAQLQSLAQRYNELSGKLLSQEVYAELGSMLNSLSPGEKGWFENTNQVRAKTLLAPLVTGDFSQSHDERVVAAYRAALVEEPYNFELMQGLISRGTKGIEDSKAFVGRVAELTASTQEYLRFSSPKFKADTNWLANMAKKYQQGSFESRYLGVLSNQNIKNADLKLGALNLEADLLSGDSEQIRLNIDSLFSDPLYGKGVMLEFDSLAVSWQRPVFIEMLQKVHPREVRTFGRVRENQENYNYVTGTIEAHDQDIVGRQGGLAKVFAAQLKMAVDQKAGPDHIREIFSEYNLQRYYDEDKSVAVENQPAALRHDVFKSFLGDYSPKHRDIREGEYTPEEFFREYVRDQAAEQEEMIFSAIGAVSDDETLLVEKSNSSTSSD